jgi:type II restriction enzyme
MPITSDKPQLWKIWKADVSASVNLYNNWFLAAAPAAFRESRAQSTEKLRLVFIQTEDLTSVTLATLERNPAVLSTLRMSSAPIWGRIERKSLVPVTAED